MYFPPGKPILGSCRPLFFLSLNLSQANPASFPQSLKPSAKLTPTLIKLRSLTTSSPERDASSSVKRRVPMRLIVRTGRRA